MRNYLLAWIGPTLSLILLPTTAFSSPRAEIAWSMITEGAVLIDVRTEQEFKQEHLESALNIPLNEIISSGRIQFTKDQPIVLYCRTGNRSNIAKQQLIKQGFTRIHNAGGLNEIRQLIANKN
ncbi:rhodanese-like domain-containing protein [Vibrio sp. V27_P1S3P104]|uniref:rhodanese-like domain-containing protein n=1 Tax=unclassified Vibrio TaxID=2614977 RepID=UPI001372E88C|nr:MULTISPECIES: rhodanese-like domain-containing protein [unclassified Vibrio]NAW68664.1 rhodanese-like domain-containing protein [Vibrio sp. V28_P6S34P95]NAX03574.1 rhodanese-like domain-containing protein [Vibrio sp. V30_P3S12P165]NAX33723.1 rhodanese-like domain-containing protein [Vibrio sp. V29_P1S30P107]NAX36666.1 rhodanese-like domain-containing protein [Vibrio sp. V27_P1S3P104]NAX40524.1 rhodanese-like domain-containing protein [Vibrio sp. V26_P1S5P106]